jgi:hypothetical protein
MYTNSLAEIMIFVSAKFQFIIMMAICDIVIKLYRTNIYIEGKCIGPSVLPESDTEPLCPEDDHLSVST